MTTKHLFNIVLKIFGLIYLKEIIDLVPGYIFPIINSFIHDSNDALHVGSGWNNIIYILIMGFYFTVIYLLLFKTNRIIGLLRLDKGFDNEEIKLEIPTSVVLDTALILIGGFVIANEIPNLCNHIVSFFQEKSFSHDYRGVKIDYSRIVISIVKIVLGLLLLGERKRVVDFIEKREIKLNEAGD